MSFIQFIADYGKKDPAFSEVIQRLMMEVPEARIQETSVYPFSTIETGFWTAQFALSPAPGGMIVYTNCSPRKDKLEGRNDNEGEKLVYAELKNGVEIVGVLAGYTFSFIKNDIAELFSIEVEHAGSQFRSRDYFPRIVGKIYKGDYSFKDKKLDVNKISEPPRDVILAIDGYGNIKTAYHKKDLKFKDGQTVKVRINNEVHTAYFSPGTFAVNDGELAFAEGSSGFDNKFMELFLRGGSAEKRFGGPVPGNKIEVLK